MIFVHLFKQIDQLYARYQFNRKLKRCKKALAMLDARVEAISK